MQDIPKVFISSTSEDLEPFRKAAEQAALRAGFFPILCEYWAAGGNLPLHECLVRVEPADLLLVLVAKRYGWVPEGGTKSITWLECERAKRKGIEILPFVLDADVDWPARLDESHRMDEALDASASEKEIDRLNAEILRNKRRLREFRNWLNAITIRGTFRSADGLGGQVLHALHEWRRRQGSGDTAKEGEQEFQRGGYLDWVKRECESIELLGLELKEAHNVRLGQIYVPAVTEPRADTESRKEQELQRDNKPALLLQRLGVESLYVPGAPGAGKSVFCRWVAWLTAAGTIPEHGIPAPEGFRETLPETLAGRLPLLCRLRDVADSADCIRGHGHWTAAQLEQALACRLDAARPGGLDGMTFLEHLEQGGCLLILDGLDELPVSIRIEGRTHYPRRNLVSGLADALPRWTQAGNRVLLTSRPYGLSAADRQGLGLPEQILGELPDPLQQTFIRRWFAAADHANRETKSAGLIEHLDTRDDLRELRANPMLLTALCVKYDEGRRLPQDIFKLYGSVVNQVLYNRFSDQAREVDPARRRLAAVALGMHTGETVAAKRETPAAAVNIDELDRILAAYAQDQLATEGGVRQVSERRETLLSRSGLLMPGGERKAGFYHLSFQEFLAAERLEILGTDIQTLLERRAATPEWRRTLVFFFCAVAERNPQAALDGFAVLLDRLQAQDLKENPTQALLLADCLEIAHARGWCLDSFAAPYRTACDQALEVVEPPARARLWDVLGLLGLDDRTGVGLDADGLPRLDWVAVPGGKIVLEDESGTHEVEPFQITRYPVTQAQF